MLPVITQARGRGLQIEKKIQNRFSAYIDELYTNCELEGKLSKDAFQFAMIGYFNLKNKNLLKNSDILSIVDFSLPSTKKRFFVLDLKKETLLYNSLVAHGRNTGYTYARRFSNVPESKKSSLGFTVTGETYYGKHGLSLRLRGTEKGFNSNALQRYIVVHGAEYVSEEFIDRFGRLGRSWGCPALPEEISDRVIRNIEDGTCFFSYFQDEEYLNSSEVLDLSTALAEFRDIFQEKNDLGRIFSSKAEDVYPQFTLIPKQQHYF
ncbi:MAG: murein L,D-transpeptidase catalytic domain family protein [Desulfohalobiaceae bacterium]|nr:murein L,D-transpeptidase catalytic domain family protein [Desulfohalobiaceae bacterium]